MTLYENLVAYEIMWKNIVEPDRPQIDNIIRCMHIAFWIPKATNTHSEYVIVLLRCHNGCTKAPECWIVRTCSVLLNLNYRKIENQRVIRFNVTEILPLLRMNLLTSPFQTSVNFQRQRRVSPLDTDLQQSTKFVECFLLYRGPYLLYALEPKYYIYMCVCVRSRVYV